VQRARALNTHYASNTLFISQHEPIWDCDPFCQRTTISRSLIISMQQMSLWMGEYSYKVPREQFPAVSPPRSSRLSRLVPRSCTGLFPPYIAQHQTTPTRFDFPLTCQRLHPFLETLFFRNWLRLSQLELSRARDRPDERLGGI
jgi:hypothetical protein